MSETQTAVYRMLIQFFRALNINPHDALPAMRQLIQDVEDFFANESTSSTIN